MDSIWLAIVSGLGAIVLAVFAAVLNTHHQAKQLKSLA